MNANQGQPGKITNLEIEAAGKEIFPQNLAWSLQNQQILMKATYTNYYKYNNRNRNQIYEGGRSEFQEKTNRN